MTSVIETKTILTVNGIDYYIEVFQMDRGRITALKFDGRVFNDASAKASENARGVEKNLDDGEDGRVCSKCNISRPSSMFYPNKGVCKICISEYNKKYQGETHQKRKSNKKSSGTPYIKLPGEKTVSPEKNFHWNEKRDRVLRDNFDELGVQGIFDKSLLPGFSLTEIRKRCMELCLIDEYGNTVSKIGG